MCRDEGAVATEHTTRVVQIAGIGTSFLMLPPTSTAPVAFAASKRHGNAAGVVIASPRFPRPRPLVILFPTSPSPSSSLVLVLVFVLAFLPLPPKRLNPNDLPLFPRRRRRLRRRALSANLSAYTGSCWRTDNSHLRQDDQGGTVGGRGVDSVARPRIHRLVRADFELTERHLDLGRRGA